MKVHSQPEHTIVSHIDPMNTQVCLKPWKFVYDVVAVSFEKSSSTGMIIINLPRTIKTEVLQRFYCKVQMVW